MNDDTVGILVGSGGRVHVLTFDAARYDVVVKLAAMPRHAFDGIASALCSPDAVLEQYAPDERVALLALRESVKRYFEIKWPKPGDRKGKPR